MVIRLLQINIFQYNYTLCLGSHHYFATK
jgi:hypothetical protein